MKIVQISIYPEKGKKHANAGGVASYTKNLMTSIVSASSKDNIFFVLCQKIDGRYESYEEDGIRVIRCFDRTPKFFWQILKEIRKISPDVVHVQQELALFGNVLTAYMLQWLLFCLRGYKTIVTLHGVVSLEKINKKFVKDNNSSLPVWMVKTGFRIIYSPLCFWVKKIIVHEELFRKILSEEYGVNREKIAVIHHGVEDLNVISRDIACEKLVLDPRRDLVLFMGYLTGYKGLDLLIDGFASYKEKNTKAFLVIGSGKHPKLADDPDYNKEYVRIQKEAEEKIGAGWYRWDGFIDEKDIVSYYSATDVSIYPYTVSMSSSGPMAFAIGYEKPFLASDVFRDIIKDEGLLFLRTAGSFSDKLDDFFREKENFRQSAKSMKQNRLWSMVAQMTIKLYGL